MSVEPAPLEQQPLRRRGPVCAPRRPGCSARTWPDTEQSDTGRSNSILCPSLAAPPLTQSLRCRRNSRVSVSPLSSGTSRETQALQKSRATSLEYYCWRWPSQRPGRSWRSAIGSGAGDSLPAARFTTPLWLLPCPRALSFLPDGSGHPARHTAERCMCQTLGP